VGIGTFFAVGALLVLVEMMGPWIAERIPARSGLRGTPWHAHHIAERYGLLAIITLGEGVIGTVASLGAVVEQGGWTVDAALVAIAGIGLTFGLWWTYFITPAATMLHRHRERSFLWGYGQMLVVASLAAVGAGLHVAAYHLEGTSHLGAVGTVVAVAAPVLVFVVVDYALYGGLTRSFDRLHVWLVAGAVALLVAAVVVAALGLPMAWALLLVMAAPAVTVVGYEAVGHRHLARFLEEDAARPVPSRA
jgi:low temperature requirement protein LtrA